ncbi:PTS transporter subunit EIIC [Enterococcus larvae]|uniref:PTS transporter subunit EIIC n=1 Tax=Enterococcus larvae TaxID=2794352 RepID=UPI003F33691B
MNNQELATEILNLVGHEENIQSVTHCFTRLRLNLKNEEVADTQAIEKLDGVIRVIRQGGQYQIVIGNHVADVYQQFIALIGTDFDQTISENQEQGHKNPVVRVLDFIASIFAPVIVAITGAGMLKAFMALFLAAGIITPDMSTYQVLSFIADSAFYYLPFLLAVSAAKKLNCNIYIAMVIAGVLLHPNFLQMMNEGPVSFLAIPVTNANYSSSVIPILLAIWLMSYIEPFLDRISPNSVKFMTKPLFTLLVIAPVTLLVLGPIGAIAGNQLAAGINAISESSFGWLVPFIVGGLAPLLVMTGMHYALIPIGLQNLASLNYDSVVGPGNMVSNISQGAACLAVAIRTKNSNLRKLAISNSISALCGITEPALYGITLKLKRPFLAVIIGGAAGGLFAGLTGVARFAAGVPGLISLPGYINPNGTFTVLIYAIIANIIAFIVTFIFTLIFGFEDDPIVEEVTKEVEERVMSME